LRIVDHALGERQRDAALKVIRELLAFAEKSPELVVACINRLVRAREYDLARSLIQEHSATLADDADFQVARASLIVATGDPPSARALFESQTFRPASILAKAPHIYLRVLRLAGRKEELEAALQTTLDQALASPDFDHLISIGGLFAELGQLEVFRNRIEETLPKSRAQRLLNMLSRRSQPSLFPPTGEEIAF
jgi:hypothetical protein